MISPTRKSIRKPDKWGSGAYGSGRGIRHHKGADFICDPGQDVVAPIEGLLIREARPYASGVYGGCLIQGKHIAIKMFYLNLNRSLIGNYVHQNDVIGTAQDISYPKYPGMRPHIHLEVESIDPEILTFI